MGFGLILKGHVRWTATSGLNALTGIDGIWTQVHVAHPQAGHLCLNALTGIDGIWT